MFIASSDFKQLNILEKNAFAFCDFGYDFENIIKYKSQFSLI
jgi:hypothetical protein